MLTDKELKHCISLIRREVSFFNGWYVNDEVVDKSCADAAKKVERYIKKRRSHEHNASK